MPTTQLSRKDSYLEYKHFGGYNPTDSDIVVEDNELTGGQNVITSDHAMEKRTGNTLYGNYIGSTTGILGLVTHEPPGGTAEFLAVYNTNIYRYVAGTWTALTGGATLTTNLKADSAFYEPTGKTYITNGTDNVQVYTSGSSIASDSNFKKGSYIVAYKNRLIVAVGKVWWWTDLRVDTFTSTNFRNVPDTVTGLEVLYDKILTFTKKQIFITQNFSFVAEADASQPSSFLPLRTKFGAIYDRTIVQNNNLVYFLGQDSEGVAAVYATDGFQVVRISEKIAADLANLAPAQLSNAAATAWGRYYRLSVTPSGQTTNTKEYLYDTIQKIWLPPFTNDQGGFSCYTTVETSGQLDVYAGSQTDGTVYKLNQAEYDEVAEESYTTVGASADAAIDANPAKRVAMGFKFDEYEITDSVPLNSVFLKLKKNAGTTTELTIRIETDNNGVPSGTLADAQATTTIAAITSTSYAYVKATFTDVTLLGNTQYHVVAKHTTEGSGDSQYYWGGDSSSPSYANGSLSTYVDSTSGTLTFNPSATASDGVLFKTSTGDSFATMRAATVGSAGNISTTAVPNIIATATTDTYSEMARMVALFDTSTLPDDAVITSATLSVYTQYVVNSLDQSIGITAVTPASNTTLVGADYAIANFGSTRFATDIDLDDLTINGYTDFTLNNDGEAAIDPEGITKFSLRLSGDIDNTAPTWASGAQSAAIIQTQEGANKPRLTIAYTSVSGSAIWTSDATKDQNFVMYIQGAIDAYGDTKAFFLAPAGQKTHIRDVFVTADAASSSSYNLEIGINTGSSTAFQTGTIPLSGGGPLYGSTFVLGSSTLGGADRSEQRLRTNGFRVRTAKFRFRNRNANEPFTVYSFRTRHQIIDKIR